MNTESKFGAAILAIWLFGAAVSLTFTGVVIWAIVKLVQHFAG